MLRIAAYLQWPRHLDCDLSSFLKVVFVAESGLRYV